MALHLTLENAECLNWMLDALIVLTGVSKRWAMPIASIKQLLTG
ncbi:MAG TPA: hypothetical protein VM260_19030 [Pirellula sp.]|nr:hypothetical protein [Pirellula sp.]